MNHDKINLKSYQHQKEQQNNKQQVDQNSQNINQNREIIKKTDKDTKNQNEKIRQLFNDNNFDFFEYNKGENFLILYENIVFYCLFVINNSSNQFQIKGKLYSVDFDQNKNPTFKIQEGIFNIDLQKKKFQLIGEGIEYLGKSKIIKFQGQFKNGQIFEIQPSSKQGLRAQSQEPIRKIIIKEGGKIINNNLKFQIKQFQPIKLWCKYNQQINERDIQILNNRRWLTSSVIDSFVLYLNLLSEKQYFKKNQNERQQISRILFLPTSLTTNFGSYYNDEKAKKLFNDELLQFQDINFELKIIYKRIGFPINKHNTHWQFLLFDYEKNQVELFDSLSFQIDQNLIQTLSRLLNLENCKQTKNEFSGQQNNGYACGYHVCSFMQHSYDLQFQKNAYYNYNESEIIQRLQKVIKDENEQ
ncbi:unnamed protein product [Paramecium sonneborni]|uniref:Ubiquitin-like protease family profile domain-containing protein n=1 Tax=Paramecium sonneborni TaxID=65129 RepID=A0A8S1RIR7_9CILI|nr:unnamed protein product [Paramecium sonneborni]